MRTILKPCGVSLAFRDAGADCVFVPGLKDAETIGRLAKAVECPLNILAGRERPRFRNSRRWGWRE
jgi:2-methylisocitrate lyase-like PEP mutase family enzyme